VVTAEEPLVRSPATIYQRKTRLFVQILLHFELCLQTAQSRRWLAMYWLSQDNVHSTQRTLMINLSYVTYSLTHTTRHSLQLWNARRRLSGSISTTEYGVLMRSVASVCLSVCLCVCLSANRVWTLTFESRPKTWYSVSRYIFIISRSSLYVKVIGSRSRSQAQIAYLSVLFAVSVYAAHAQTDRRRIIWTSLYKCAPHCRNCRITANYHDISQPYKQLANMSRQLPY